MSRVTVLYNEVLDADDPAALDVLTQCKEIRQALGQLGHSTDMVACTLDLASARKELQRSAPDLVFNLVESLGGTDRLMAATTLLLDSMQLPYTGSRTSAILLSGDKLRAKFAMVASGISTPAWFDTRTASWQPSQMDSASFTDTVIVKSVYEHASLGMENDAIAPFDGTSSLLQRLAERLQHTGHKHLAEQYIAGREFNLSLLEIDGQPRVLAHAEIDFRDLPAGLPHIVGHRAKWLEDSIEYKLTPRRFDFTVADQALIAELSELAIKCWQRFEMNGYARVDFRVDQLGRPYVLEVNANPCLSQDAGFVAAASESGIEHTELIRTIIAAALC
ncbi:MAG: hypothetical protein WBD20_11780 [Pirellulaceae bacterium]